MSEQTNVNDVFQAGTKTGRAFPDALDGTPQDYASKTVAQEQSEAAIEKPMTNKIKGGDVNNIIQKCREAIEAITDFEVDRKEINAEITAVRERLETLGIGKKPLSMAISYSKLNTEQREGFDLAYSILRQAIGEGIKQVDMFYDNKSLFSESINENKI